MKLDLHLYIRRHRSGFFTVRVLGDHPLELYTDDLDQAREDLELVVGDLVDRSHPRRQSTFSSVHGAEAHILEVPDLLTVHGQDGPEKIAGEFTALVSGTAWCNVWLPRLDLHVFIKNRRRAWEHETAALVAKHLKHIDEGGQIERRLDAEEWVEAFQVEASPPPLTKFVGKYRGLDILPLPADESDEREQVRQPHNKPHRPPTPTLSRIGVDLGELARDGELERAHERKTEVDELFALVSGPRKQAIAIVGSAGVGKSTVLNELAHRIAHEKPESKACRPIYFVDASRLVAGDNWFGDWQRQTLDILEECAAADVVWFVGSLLALLDAGKHIASEQNVAMLMKPILAGHRVTVVGECSIAAWSQLELRDAGFARLFSVFRLEEPSAQQGDRILQLIARDQERSLGVQITPTALKGTRELSKRYVSATSPLGAAAHLLRRVAEAATASPGSSPVIDRDTVVRHFCTETGLPDFLVRDDLPLPADKITDAFRRRLIGQDQALGLMTSLVTVIKAGLSDLGRPLGSFLFVGPTGVGKTETAKALAHFLFGSEHRLTRFDMSEFSGWDAVHRFLGQKDQEGKLVAAVRRRPFSVVLLDEIEKASPAIFDVLLQVLGEARLTDEAGRSADFKNVVVIMTSNLGVDTLKRSLGFDSASLEEQYRSHFLAEAQRFFRPELFNRIDHIVPFLPLGPAAIRAITAREVDKFLRREGLRQKRVDTMIDDDVRDWLAERGVDERYGARPLKRVIERELTSPLARALADGIPEGTRAIQISAQDDRLAFEWRSSKSKTSLDDSPLDAIVTRVQDLRFRHRCWCDTASFKEAKQRLRLLERLSQNKRFWDDKALAEARLAGVETDRRLVDSMTEIGQRIDSLDDLVHDAFFSGDGSTVADLEGELREVTSTLADEELALHSRDLGHPDAATLFLKAGQNGVRFLERTAVVYAELAREHGWQLRVNFLRLEREAESPTKPRSTPPKRGGRRKDESEPVVAEDRKAKRKKPDKQAKLKWLNRQHEQLHLDIDEEESLRPKIGKLLVHHDEDDTLVFFVEGRHAGTLLTEEAGQHQRVSSEGVVSVAVRARPGLDFTAPPIDFIHGGLVKIRVVDERKHLVEDTLLGLHFPYEPRVWRIYERFMRARPFKKAFGPNGIRWFRAWETS